MTLAEQSRAIQPGGWQSAICSLVCVRARLQCPSENCICKLVMETTLPIEGKSSPKGGTSVAQDVRVCVRIRFCRPRWNNYVLSPIGATTMVAQHGAEGGMLGARGRTSEPRSGDTVLAQTRKSWVKVGNESESGRVGTGSHADTSIVPNSAAPATRGGFKAGFDP